MRRVIDEMNCGDITICYGMTETSPVSFQTKVSDPIHRKTETVGTVHPHLECKVIDEDNQIVKCGENLENFCVKGYAVMEGGYWAQKDKTTGVIDEEGFMHTGDLCTIDSDGYYTVTGRAGDMIIRGGENIYPTEVENLLYQHPDIRDVSVIGVPDPKYIEECCAYVIPHEGGLCTARKCTSISDKELKFLLLTKSTEYYVISNRDYFL
eukprot:TRINITY_DN12892_c0_g1_i1.p1 TRINITY_DN12892_c0_g1~~TRINITY_DN12892_c0_g1_i1.p1  ORF type:complete len:209 (+),score=20.08 TRINITY_DN12892_c0_g1_i1:240-866(+)